MYDKRIVCDFDDTLSFAENRDFKNAKPNTNLIQELNRLYDSGWTIDIFTARGHLSCKDRKEAENTYRNDIEEWLSNNNVYYSSLSFNKPLAVLYIDDKAIRQDEIHRLKELN